ncbi:MAG TPA: restriction endonuclease subunit S [Fimbriiglobus sp.]|nr:restriction endonuclease subunit S [Fimbriiglobus sp.]
MSAWPMVKLGEVLTHRKEFIQIDDFAHYKRCRVQVNAQGVVLRDQVPGTEIKTKKQQVCKAGEFLVAEIDAKQGGYGIVPDDLEGAIVSSHYFLFRIIESKIALRFLGWYIRTPAFFEQVAAQGSTNYAAIRPSHVLGYEIPLPPLAEQRRLVARIDALAAKIDEAKQATIAIERRNQELLNAAFQDIAENAPRQRLAVIAPLNRRPATVDPMAEYPQVSVRSFGRGTFHNPPLKGSEITWEKPHRVEAGDILISNIKAWEGAIAVAKPQDGGRYGSHRYLTYVPVPNVATARFVCFYLLSPEGLFHVGEASPGSADRNRTTSAKGLLEIPVPLPSYSKQVWFGNLFDKIEGIRTTQTAIEGARNALLPAILDRAFRGEL